MHREIAREVFTNSFLICPPLQEPITHFYWQRNRPHFHPSSVQMVPQSVPELSYQCTLLDYHSTIELVVLVTSGETEEKQLERRVFAYGPVQLESELVEGYSDKPNKYEVQIVFSKKHSILGSISHSKQETSITIELEVGSMNVGFKH